MTQVYFVTKEQYDDYDKRLNPDERFTDTKLRDLGISNLRCGNFISIAISPSGADAELPPKFYEVMKRNPL